MFQRALLFANGELPHFNWLKNFITSGDYLIAVDGGLHHLMSLEIKPHLLLGDLDSVTPAEIKQMKSQGVEIRQFPVQKDETDLELALLAAVKQNFQELVIIAALGGRLDQTLGNLSLLLSPELQELNVRLEDGHQEVFLIHDTALVHGQKGDTVSLLPLWGDVDGVTTANLAYPLHNETLFCNRSRGISNMMQDNQAQISVTRGPLLCIHMHQTKFQE